MTSNGVPSFSQAISRVLTKTSRWCEVIRERSKLSRSRVGNLQAKPNMLWWTMAAVAMGGVLRLSLGPGAVAFMMCGTLAGGVALYQSTAGDWIAATLSIALSGAVWMIAALVD